MTMFSAEKRQFCGGGYGEAGFGVMSQLQGYSSFSTSSGTPLMADDNELRNEDSLNEGAEESSSKDIIIAPDIDQRDEEWLQLSIGGHRGRIGNDHHCRQKNNKGSNSNLVDLELMPSSEYSSQILMPEFRAPRPPPVTISSDGTFTPFLLQQQQQHHNPAAATSITNLFPQQEINWALIRPIPISTVAPPSSSNSSSVSYFQAVYGGVDNNMVGLDFRVIQPPRRPHSGIWFMLQASQNQEKEPFLPQISKSYLRIKDGRMTIRLVIKYLANKLRLENESEIEIRCKGQRLLPFLTLQHVRDNIWSNPRDFITLLPNSTTTHHIMVLYYARTASN